MAKTFIETIREAAECGANININLVSKSVKVDGKKLIAYGQFEGELGIDFSEYDTSEKVISYIEELYERYKHSVPSEKEGSRRNYFYALNEKDMSDEDMLYGESRTIARVELEFTILAATITGALTWDESWGSYFWQSKKDRDFVILKSWF